VRQSAASSVTRSKNNFAGCGYSLFDALTASLNIKKGKFMLYTIAVIMLVLWLLGLITSNTMGGFIHILLVIAIVVILLRIIG
jgi:hypothetical protein